MIIILTSCSAKKDDSIPIPDGSRIVQPTYYLDDKGLISRFHSIRKRIFQDPGANVGTKITYAYDLYVRAGKAYKDLMQNNYQRLKSILISGNDIEWFFLSGGYGIIHTLEAAKKYQATFNRNIASQRRIPFTASLWKDTLTSIYDAIISKFNPEWVYVFGSRDYTQFIKQIDYWKTKSNIKMFESTGSVGPTRLSAILNELISSIIDNNVNVFNAKYDKYTLIR